MGSKILLFWVSVTLFGKTYYFEIIVYDNKQVIHVAT